MTSFALPSNAPTRWLHVMHRLSDTSQWIGVDELQEEENFEEEEDFVGEGCVRCRGPEHACLRACLFTQSPAGRPGRGALQRACPHGMHSMRRVCCAACSCRAAAKQSKLSDPSFALANEPLAGPGMLKAILLVPHPPFAFSNKLPAGPAWGGLRRSTGSG